MYRKIFASNSVSNCSCRKIFIVHHKILTIIINTPHESKCTQALQQTHRIAINDPSRGTLAITLGIQVYSEFDIVYKVP